jgi:hypothetical protein
MPYEHDGMRLWVEPDQRLASGAIELGSDVNLTIGVEPADASNRVQVIYRVNGGPATAIAAEPVRHVGNMQYFKAQLPCAALCSGDTVDYSAVCQCAGRQVPSAPEAERFASSFKVMNAAVTDAQATALSYPRDIEFAPATSPFLTRGQAAVRSANLLKQTHLSLFVLERNSGRPIARMPFYAEVGVNSVLLPPKPECKLEGVIRIALQGIMRSASHGMTSSFSAHAYIAKGMDTPVPINSPSELSEALVEPLCDALCGLMTPKTIDLMADQAKAMAIINGILQKAGEFPNVASTDWNNPQSVRQLLEEAIRAYAKEHDLPLAGENERNLPLAGENVQGQRIVWAHPLGVLATDHVGYLSFDLTRLPEDAARAVALAIEARRRNPSTPTATSIWLYPMAREEERIDALAQMRFAHDAIVVKLELDPPNLPEALKKMGLLAMQKPDLTDWRLSPSSFAVSPSALLGEDGCENLFPANVALQEYYFYQVIGLTDQDAQPPELQNERSGKVRVGFLNEYRLAWYPLGHSLGQIQYSLPLAPGESVNLAIIDWTRRDVGKRTEDTKEAEQLVHNQRRDRTITETVNAAIQEHQSGSSIMGGLAGAVGASIPIKAVNVAVGATHSLGGAMSESGGSREISGSTVQKLSDNISQASAAMRELQSTVVVQTTQSEKETIETRTVVNYNHSHALTILYYEVLRHFRVVTEYLRRRPVVLVKLDSNFLSEALLITAPRPLVLPSGDPAAVATAIALDTQQRILYHQAVHNLLEHRAVLEAALLDSRHAEAFNALQRIVHRVQVATATPAPSPPPQFDHSQREFRHFIFEMTTGGMPNDDIVIRADLKGNPSVQLMNKATGFVRDVDFVLNPPGSFTLEGTSTFVAGPRGDKPIKWNTINAISIRIEPGDKTVSFRRIKITAVDVNGYDAVLLDFDYRARGGDLLIALPSSIALPLSPAHIVYPSAPPPPAPRPIEEIEDEAKVNELIDHIRYHRAHYSRAVYLNQNVAERARELDAVKLPQGTLLEKVENRPLEMIGDFVAYPCTDAKWAEQIKNFMNALPLPEPVSDERLVTLPTRGVFAEAKLGHCNASEVLDPDRFWKWEEHPVLHLAPEIAAIAAGQHTVKDLDLKSTPFPQSMVNIVNPPAAPDPTGLAAALKVLGTPDIFRDMSGREEVADLLKKLSDNSVSIADAANKAKEIQKKYGDNLLKTPSDSGSSPVSQPTKPPAEQPQPKPTPEQQEKQHLENQSKKLDMADRLPKPQKDEVRKEVVNELTKPKKTWTIQFNSVWVGEAIRQPMYATYNGELFFDDGGDSKYLEFRTTDSVANWKVEREGTPSALKILASEVKPFTGEFSIAVPGIKVDEMLSLKKTTYSIPLRGAANTLPGELIDTFNDIKIKDKETLLKFQGTGKIGKKDIEVIAEVSPLGELTGDFASAFTAEVPIEILKLALSGNLKAAVKTTISGKAGIKGTVEILYLVGYEVKQL